MFPDWEGTSGCLAIIVIAAVAATTTTDYGVGCDNPGHRCVAGREVYLGLSLE